VAAEAGPVGLSGMQEQADLPPDTLLRLAWRPYTFRLPRAMVTSQGAWSLRRGWLLRLNSDAGRLGWGEAASPAGHGAEPDHAELRAAVSTLPAVLGRQKLEERLPHLPAPLACALGMALAELDGLGSASQGGWLSAPASALLLPAGEAAITTLEQALTPGAAGRAQGPVQAMADREGPSAACSSGLTVKWKVASGDDALEREVLESLLKRLPAGARLRLDANGGWQRATAWRWAERLAGDQRLEWLEQPLAATDRQGLEDLARRLPVALDESLRLDPPRLSGGWPGWQVRRPLLEGDPRPLLAALQAGTPRLMLSTGLETGIGRRLLNHLAGLQARGPTPTAPGLAPGWRPGGPLFSTDPEQVWEAAG